MEEFFGWWEELEKFREIFIPVEKLFEVRITKLDQKFFTSGPNFGRLSCLLIFVIFLHKDIVSVTISERQSILKLMI